MHFPALNYPALAAACIVLNQEEEEGRVVLRTEVGKPTKFSIFENSHKHSVSRFRQGPAMERDAATTGR